MLRKTRRTRRVGALRTAVMLSALILIPTCDDRDGLTAPSPTTPTVEGRVLSAATGVPVAGASVSIGEKSVTTGLNGHFRLTDLTPGISTLRSVATGFEEFEVEISVVAGRTRRDIPQIRIETFQFGDFAFHAPATAQRIRAILVALGGPDTRGFAAGSPFGAPRPELEAALQGLGQEFRVMAASKRIAILGTSRAHMPNDPANDRQLLEAVREAAALSGRPELPGLPLLVYGISGGAPQASGFATRNPQRVAGLILKVPAGLEPVTGGAAIVVPVYMLLAELDAFIDNPSLAATFKASRKAGAPWALAVERAVPHHALTPSHRAVTVNWMKAILALRLGEPAAEPADEAIEMYPVAETAGWLGDLSNGSVSAWAAYTGDPRSASWLPTQETAEEWTAFVGGSGLVRIP